MFVSNSSIENSEIKPFILHNAFQNNHKCKCSQNFLQSSQTVQDFDMDSKNIHQHLPHNFCPSRKTYPATKLPKTNLEPIRALALIVTSQIKTYTLFQNTLFLLNVTIFYFNHAYMHACMDYSFQT